MRKTLIALFTGSPYVYIPCCMQAVIQGVTKKAHREKRAQSTLLDKWNQAPMFLELRNASNTKRSSDLSLTLGTISTNDFLLFFARNGPFIQRSAAKKPVLPYF
ncbi:hypothetical protein J6590_000114 [Homalodisca vitripennis]|nr:hypothetical protein J6590_000114 [Homalodisca vitripennis]